MKNLFLLLSVLSFTTFFAQYGSGMQQGMQRGMQGGGNQMNQMSQPRVEEKKPDLLTNEQLLKKMTIITGLDGLQQLQIRELLLKMPKPTDPKSKEEFEQQQQITEKFNDKLKKIMSEDQIEKWRKDRNKMLPEEKAETRKEKKERLKKQEELLDNLK